MSISSRISRPLLASIFITGGLDAVRNPESKVKTAEKVTGPLTQHIPVLPDDTATLVRLNGGAQVAAGVLLSLGKFRRLSALVLIGSIIPTTYAGHRFWDEVDDEKRAQQQVHFLKNLGLLGGLILAATDNEGAPSVSWRVRRQVRNVGGKAAKRKGAAKGTAGHALKNVSDAGVHAWQKIDDVAGKEATKGAEIAGRYLASGADLSSALLAQAQDRLASA
jgi:putative oxidoreductase